MMKKIISRRQGGEFEKHQSYMEGFLSINDKLHGYMGDGDG